MADRESLNLRSQRGRRTCRDDLQISVIKALDYYAKFSIYTLCFCFRFITQSPTRNFCCGCRRYSNVAASMTPCSLYSARPTCCRPCSTLKRKKRFSSNCRAHRAMNFVSVFSVSGAISTNVFERNFSILSSIAFLPGFPVPMETKHLTRGFSSLRSEHQILVASSSTSSTGLLAPRAPSTNWREPIETGSKKPVAAEVARAASPMVARTLSSSGKL
jgi:hypothetical protein